MKELLWCSVPLIATENIVISNSHSASIILRNCMVIKYGGGGGGGAAEIGGGSSIFKLMK